MAAIWLSPTNKASTGNTDMMSAVVKLAEEIEESSSYGIGYGMAFHSMTSSRDKVWRATLSFLSRPPVCMMQVDDVSSDEKVGTMRLMRLSLTNKASTYNADMMSAMVKLVMTDFGQSVFGQSVFGHRVLPANFGQSVFGQN